NGGLRDNIIAPEVKMTGTLRTLNEDVHKRVPELMEQILKGVTEANGATYEISWEKPGDPVTFNDPKLVEETLPTMERVVGAANLVKLDPKMPAEDFSFYQQQAPGFYYFLGVRN